MPVVRFGPKPPARNLSEDLTAKGFRLRASAAAAAVVTAAPAALQGERKVVNEVESLMKDWVRDAGRQNFKTVRSIHPKTGRMSLGSFRTGAVKVESVVLAGPLVKGSGAFVVAGLASSPMPLIPGITIALVMAAIRLAARIGAGAVRGTGAGAVIRGAGAGGLVTTIRRASPALLGWLVATLGPDIVDWVLSTKRTQAMYVNGRLFGILTDDGAEELMNSVSANLKRRIRFGNVD